jgi:hypothetical protein
MFKEEIYTTWLKSNENGRFSWAILNSNTSIFKMTIEGLGAFKAYASLPSEEQKAQYAVHSSHLNPLFFALTKEEIERVERELPPYPLLLQMVYNDRRISKEEIEFLNQKPPKNPIKAREIQKIKEKIFRKYELLSKEWDKISRESEKMLWKCFRKIILPFYAINSLQVYLLTQNLIPLVTYLLSFPIPYQLLKYCTYKISNIKIRKCINNLLTLYFFLKSPVGASVSTLEFGFGAPLASAAIEKIWQYLPEVARRGIYKTGNWFSGIKKGKFDEEEIRKALYDIKIDSNVIPKDVIERFKTQIEDGTIEIEDPSKVLLKPYALSWWRRKVVAIPEGKEIRIIDKSFIRKLAQKEGAPLEEFEKKIKKFPYQYLGFGLYDNKLVYTRNLIGILPCQIMDALIYKEGYTTILAEKSDKIIKELASKFSMKTYRIKSQ